MKDVNNPPYNGYGPGERIEFNGVLYFSYTDIYHGRELWRSDGTDEGTYLLADINPEEASSNPREFVVFNNQLLFIVDMPVSGTEIWTTDGEFLTAHEEVEVAANTVYRELTHLAVLDETLFITQEYDEIDPNHETGIYKYEAGDLQATFFYDFPDVGASYDTGNLAYVVNGKLLIQHFDEFFNEEWWSTDGITMTYLTEIQYGAGYQQYLVHNDKLYFSKVVYDFSDVIYELWVTDGTPLGTYAVYSISTLLALEYEWAFELTVLGDYVYFKGFAYDSGYELWRSDGTIAGTDLFADLSPDIEFGTYPIELEAFNGHVYFIQPLEDGAAIWRTNGTLVGTQIWMTDLPNNGGTNYRDFQACGGHMYLQAYDQNAEDTFWRTDGSVGGTVMLDFPIDLYLAPLFLYAGQCMFTENAPSELPHYYRIHESTGVITMVEENNYVGLFDGSDAHDFVKTSNAFYFIGDHYDYEDEVWATDGTEAGTHLTKDIVTGEDSSLPKDLTASGDKVYFKATTYLHGEEMWRSDGSDAGTFRLTDINAGTASSNINNMAACNDFVYFTANNNSIKAINNSTDALVNVGSVLNPMFFHCSTYGNEVNFIANTGNEFSMYSIVQTFPPNLGTWGPVFGGVVGGGRLNNPDLGVGAIIGREPFENSGRYDSDGQTVYYSPWGELYSNWAHSGPFMYALDTVTYFGDAGDDMNILGYNTLSDEFFHPFEMPLPSDLESNWNHLVGIGTKLIFPYDYPGAGNELVIYDSQTNTLSLLYDINPGPESSDPTLFYFADGNAYYIADDGVHGREVWKTLGTTSTTELLADIWPGTQTSFPKSPRIVGDKIMFTATTIEYGAEPYWINHIPNEISVIATSQTETACEGNSISVSASTSSDEYTYQWFRDFVLLAGETNSNLTFENITEDMGGTYICYVTNSNELSAISTIVTLNVGTAPSMSAVGTGSEVCEGDEVAILVTTDAQWPLTQEPPTVSQGAYFQIDESTTYSLYGFSPEGCPSDTVEISFLVHPNPMVNVVEEIQSGCDGDTLIFNATGASTYEWTGNAEPNGASVLYIIFADVIWEVTGTDEFGCTGTDTFTIDELPDGANPVLSGIQSDYCIYDDAEEILTTVEGGAFFGNGVSGNMFSPSVAGAGVHTVTYIVEGDGCGTGEASIEVEVHNAPFINAYASPDVACEGSTIELHVSNAEIIAWSTGQNTNNFEFIATESGSNSVTITDEYGCQNSASVSWTVNPTPTVVWQFPYTDMCVNDPMVLIEEGTPAGGYFIGQGTLNEFFDPAFGAGYYLLFYIYENEFGCADTAGSLIQVHNLPAINISGDLQICDGESTTLLASGGASYIWSTNQTSNSITVSPASNQTYSVEGTDSFGCSNLDEVNVVVNENPVVSLTLLDDSLCLNQMPYTLNGGLPIGGTFSGNSVNGNQLNTNTANTYTITYNYTNNDGCSGTAADNIVVDDCIGIEEENNSAAFFIFPNPTSTYLNLSCHSKLINTYVEIYAADMRLVKRILLKSQMNTIDTIDMSSGIYFLRVGDEFRKFEVMR
ncbi:MAG: ELWxxDGT repeat protein [Flavobacteriales bacterium]